MPLTLNVAPAIRFHLSLNVCDLARSLDFYRVLFGVEPAKRRLGTTRRRIRKVLGLSARRAAAGLIA